MIVSAGAGNSRCFLRLSRLAELRLADLSAARLAGLCAADEGVPTIYAGSDLASGNPVIRAGVQLEFGRPPERNHAGHLLDSDNKRLILIFIDCALPSFDSSVGTDGLYDHTASHYAF